MIHIIRRLPAGMQKALFVASILALAAGLIILLQ